MRRLRPLRGCLSEPGPSDRAAGPRIPAGTLFRMRRLRRYPPFADLFSFTVTGADESRVIRAAKALRDALGYAVERREELDEAIAAMKASEGAFLLEVRVEGEENIFPMVPAGAPVSEIRFE